MKEEFHSIEKPAAAISGMGMLFLVLGLLIISIGSFIYGIREQNIPILIAAIAYWIIFPFVCAGFKVLKPNEAYVLTLFGKYYGTLKGPGFYMVNPFVTATYPENEKSQEKEITVSQGVKSTQTIKVKTKKISLKAMTLNNDKQKINDSLGNPIEIGIVVIWRVINTAQAIFNVDNYPQFLSIQCDSALRSIIRLYPYDVPEDAIQESLRGSSEEVSEQLKAAIQEKVDNAGLEIIEARITHLAYAPEIAAAMLQRQQASAIIDARKIIVDGAVGMVELALEKLNDHEIVVLDEERKAAMVSNLLVVLCGNKDAQPIVNSGSIY